MHFLVRCTNLQNASHPKSSGANMIDEFQLKARTPTSVSCCRVRDILAHPWIYFCLSWMFLIFVKGYNRSKELKNKVIRIMFVPDERKKTRDMRTYVRPGNTLPKERTRNFAIRILGPTLMNVIHKTTSWELNIVICSNNI